MGSRNLGSIFLSIPVDDLEERDVVVLCAVEGDDEEDVVVDVAVAVAAVAQVDARAEALYGPGRQLLVLVRSRLCGRRKLQVQGDPSG